MAPKAIEYGTYKQILNQTSRTTVLPDVYYNEIPQELRRMAFTVSGISRMSVLKDILDKFDAANQQGIPYEQWAADFNIPEFMDLTENHKRTVYQTNMSTSYNNGRLQIASNSDTLKFLKFQATLDERTRPNHAANDGITLPANDPWWQTNTPPLGFNCRCFVLNLDEKDLSDNPLTPKSDLTKAMAPDDGFDFSVKNPESAITKVYREKARELPSEIRTAALDRLMDKSSDQAAWWKKNKKDFENPE